VYFYEAMWLDNGEYYWYWKRKRTVYSNPINYYLKPTAENQPIQSDTVIFKKVVLIAFVSIEISLTFLVRNFVPFSNIPLLGK